MLYNYFKRDVHVKKRVGVLLTRITNILPLRYKTKQLMLLGEFKAVYSTNHMTHAMNPMGKMKSSFNVTAYTHTRT
jgi:hypothetical protein